MTVASPRATKVKFVIKFKNKVFPGALIKSILIVFVTFLLLNGEKEDMFRVISLSIFKVVVLLPSITSALTFRIESFHFFLYRSTSCFDM